MPDILVNMETTLTIHTPSGKKYDMRRSGTKFSICTTDHPYNSLTMDTDDMEYIVQQIKHVQSRHEQASKLIHD